MGNQTGSENAHVHGRFSDNYVTEDLIGSGTFAVVKKCYRKAKPDQAFAVKIVDKKHLTARELVGLKYEVKILQTMEHPSIMKAVDVFEDRRRVKIVLELCEGGDLFDQMLKEKDKRLDERRSAWITCKLSRALKYLHEHHVCHRDLKPENVLFTKNGNIKVADFGLAHYLKLPPAYHTMRTCCGTPHYVAPEVLGSEQYGVQIDFWSLGVILYIMLSGYQPFNSKSIRTMYSMITRGQYRFPRPHWDHVSVDGISCVKGLMNLNPEERLNYETLSQHPFIVNNVDLKEIEKEEKQLLEEQQVLMEGSCSQLLPDGIRFPYDPKAAYRRGSGDRDGDGIKDKDKDKDKDRNSRDTKTNTSTDKNDDDTTNKDIQFEKATQVKVYVHVNEMPKLSSKNVTNGSVDAQPGFISGTDQVHQQEEEELANLESHFDLPTPNSSIADSKTTPRR